MCGGFGAPSVGAAVIVGRCYGFGRCRQVVPLRISRAAGAGLPSAVLIFSGRGAAEIVRRCAARRLGLLLRFLGASCVGVYNYIGG